MNILLSGVLVKDRYEIVRVIRQHNLGFVYLAFDKTTPDNRKMALKEYSAVVIDSVERSQMYMLFQQEALPLSKINHPNVCTITDFFLENNIPYIVMDYIEDAVTLENAVWGEEGFLPLKVVLEWGIQLCSALSHLHSFKPPIISCDLSPANIFLKKDNQLKLVDFGLNKAFDPRKDVLKRMGTVGYASPEQFSEEGTVDIRSDIFALGATLYYLLTKVNPADSPFIFLSIRSFNPSVPEEVEKAIAKAVEIDPQKRFQSADELKEILVHNLPIETKFQHKRKKFNKKSSLEKRIAILIIFLIFLLLIIILFSISS